jgi:hypothetical protein
VERNAGSRRGDQRNNVLHIQHETRMRVEYDASSGEHVVVCKMYWYYTQK